MADDFGYHIDHHGSLVRPAGLLAARAAGGASATAAEEAAIVAAAHEQRRLTLSAMSDGQFRRDFFESVAYDRISGFGPCAGVQALADVSGIAPLRRRSAPADPTATGQLAADEAGPVLATVDRPVFVTLPSPAYLAALGSSLTGPDALDFVGNSGHRLGELLAAEAMSLSEQGVAYVAFSNPLYPPLLTADGREQLAAAGLDVDEVLRLLLEVDNALVGRIVARDEFRVGLDLTDSGPLPTTGHGYDGAAVDLLVQELRFHRLSVDFPDELAHRVPIERIKPGVVLSLGVIDVSSAAPESVEAMLDRLDPVLEARGTDDVAIATNGGFAQVAAEPNLTEAEQREKLGLVERVARYYWGNEI